MALRTVFAILFIDAAFLAWAFTIGRDLTDGDPVVSILAATAGCLVALMAMVLWLEEREG